MMKKLISLVNSKLWLKVLLPVSLSVVMIMGASLWVGINAQNRLGREQMSRQNATLARAVEGGMFDALAIGDNDTVRTQFRRLSEKAEGLKVYVYDFNKVISFSTDADTVGRSMDAYADTAAADIGAMLASGAGSGSSLKVRQNNEDFLIISDPILNEKECFHCHGSSRKVLGGISVLSSMTAMQQNIAGGRNLTLMISVTGLALIVLLVWMIFFFIVNKKVVLVLQAATRLRQKDFSQDSEFAHGDEINHILNRINLVSRELRSTIGTIMDSSDNLAQSSIQMSDIAHTLDASSSEASQKAVHVAAAAEEMSVNNRAIASAMDDATDTLNALASAVDEMSTTVAEIAKNASDAKQVNDTVVSDFHEISTAVNDLGRRAAVVDKVTDEIRSIAEQVSLLALNAKIEAARAGESGKGFAVVAQEITELASDTNQSTLEVDHTLAGIKNLVQDLNRRVSDLTANVKGSDHAISGIAASVEEQNATTVEIAKSINEVSTKISNVNERVAQGAEAAGEIARDIVGVEEMSSNVKNESHTLNQGANGLAKMAESFAELMKQFKV